MTNTSLQSKNIDNERLSKLEYSIQHLEYRMNKEIPSNLAEKLTIIDPKFERVEQRFETEINNLKRDLADAKVSMKERLAFISIIVTLIIALVTLALKIIRG